MSAWFVSKAHMDVLVHAALESSQYGGMQWHDRRGHHREVTHALADWHGRMLWGECARSIAGRYYGSEHTEENTENAQLAEAYTYTAPRQLLGPVALLKQISCYEYQSCEHDGWQKSHAWYFCQALRAHLEALLPGWEGAPWGVPDPEEETAAGPLETCPRCGVTAPAAQPCPSGCGAEGGV